MRRPLAYIMLPFDSSQAGLRSHIADQSSSWLASVLLGICSLCASCAWLQPALAQSSTNDEAGFVALFDGKTLTGWTAAEENSQNWKVQDGQIVAQGERSHLFYTGSLAPFKNFHFKAEVMTTPGSNAGLYFHTKYQASGWPKAGYECQVNVSHSDPKKSSSLYGVENVADPGLKDNQWYTQEIIVQGKHIVLKINGRVMVDYTEPEGQKAFSADFERRLGEGTFAIQAHDPKSVCYFRNIRVKKLD